VDDEQMKLAALTAAVEIAKVKGTLATDTMVEFLEKIYRTIRKLQKED
jgi:hypothetical protein